MKIINPKQLSNYLKDERSSQNLTQKQMADKVGLRQMTVSSFENDPDTKRLDTLFRLLSSLALEM